VSNRKHDDWAEAKRRCRLSDEEVRMAKELGFAPRALIKNIPSPSQLWKAPVAEWVRGLYEKKVTRLKPPPAAAAAPESRGTSAPVIPFRNARDPWPDHPDIPRLVMDDSGWDFTIDSYGVPDDDVAEQNASMQRRQRLFRWGAQSIAISLAKLTEVQQVAAFGGVAQPLKMEVPRFPEFRRHRIEVLHECGDLDLAVWLTRFDQLAELQSALKRGLAMTRETPYGGVAHHQVDVHLFDAASGEYRGRLCNYRECPKQGKRDCFATGCGAEKFLQQFNAYHFSTAQFAASPKVVLFERESGFLARPPDISAPPVKWIPADRSSDVTDDDVPF
jgi:hypothetical protein